MRDWMKLYCRFWHDEKVAELATEEKLVALYVLSAPTSNRIGCYRLSLSQLAEDTGVPLDRVGEILARVVDTLGWRYDAKAKIIYLPNWWRFNAPDSRCTLRGYLKDVRRLPSSPLVDEFRANVHHLPGPLAAEFRAAVATPSGEGGGEALGEAPPEGGGEAMADNETETETETERERERRDGASPLSAGADPLPPGKDDPREEADIAADLMARWNAHPSLRPMRSMTGERRRALWARMRDPDWRDRWRAGIDRIAASAFCRGVNDRRWKANVDWFLEPDTLTKVLEGKYDDAPANQPAPSNGCPSVEETTRRLADQERRRAEIQRAEPKAAGGAAT